jgi:hypothetical protein
MPDESRTTIRVTQEPAGQIKSRFSAAPLLRFLWLGLATFGSILGGGTGEFRLLLVWARLRSDWSDLERDHKRAG